LPIGQKLTESRFVEQVRNMSTTPKNEYPKRKLIKDPLWGSSAILPWEEVVIEHPIFARLNNVLQNSTAYRVYPGLRVSRFSHSLGVMYVASRLFRSALLQHEVEGLFKPLPGRKVKGKRGPKLKHQSLEAEAAELAKTIPKPARLIALARRVFPLHHYDGKQARNSFYICHSMLRIASLLHDVGHLPYSHIFEFALFAMVKGPFDWKGKGTGAEKTVRRQEFAALVQSHLPGKLHEYFGEKLMAFLASSCKEDLPGIPIEELIHGSIQILHTNSYPILKSFISGDVDADRIDFIRRDTEYSGLLHSAVDYERLFTFYQLQKAVPSAETYRLNQEDSGKSSDSYVAAPGLRAISDIEKLLSERFQDYKYIACHHRVHLSDELLDRCVMELGRKGHLQSLFTCMCDLSSSTPRLGKMHKLLQTTENLMALLTEFDDSWLEMKFRELYRLIHAEDPLKLDPHAKELLVIYVEGTGKLQSAFHSDDDFWRHAETHYSKLCELRLRGMGGIDEKPAEAERRRREAQLKDIASVVSAGKRDWEKEWFSKNSQLLIIGDVSQKLKIGFSPVAKKQYATLVALNNLYDFLNEKVMDTMPFNFWACDDEKNSSKTAIFNFIRDKVVSGLNQLSPDSLNLGSARAKI
jgi:HD superfamily phosphohydrolase